MEENRIPVFVFAAIAFSLIMMTIFFPYSKTQKEFAKKCESVFHGVVLYDVGLYTATCVRLENLK
jgi:hypothetical protein